MLSAPTQAHIKAVAHSVGRSGMVMAVEPNRSQAERLAKKAANNISVVAIEPEGEEKFGTFDAILACPLSTLGWPLEKWTSLFAANSRPGSRFVLDLPGEVLNENLASCWEHITGNRHALQWFSGPAELDMAQVCRDATLRNVHASMGTHLVHLTDPFMLADYLSVLEDIAEEQIQELGQALTETLKANQEVDLVFHRTRVRGQR